MDLLTRISLIMLHLSSLYRTIYSHGRLLEPPARNTLWRFGYKAPPNYNDNELFCGGIGGIVRNSGKCGVCGDPFDGARIHETGHIMALNKTTRNFFPGSTIDIMIEIVANHGGTFEFEMCWRDDLNVVETEECFERLRLSKVANLEADSMKARYSNLNETLSNGQELNSTTAPGPTLNNTIEPVTHENSPETDDYNDFVFEIDPNAGTGIFSMSVELPHEKSCEYCIFRWHWRSANNWGVCEDGSERVGCGFQEIYRNCADISVKRNGAGIGLGLQRQRRRR